MTAVVANKSRVDASYDISQICDHFNVVDLMPRDFYLWLVCFFVA
jgi:hypothetical protein